MDFPFRTNMKRTFLLLICIALLSSTTATAAAEDERLTVDECIELAYGYHPSLKAKESRVDEARGTVVTARSPFLPQISGEATVDRFMRPMGIKTPAAGHPASHIFNEQTLPQATIKIDQTIYDFGRTLNSYRDAKLGTRISESSVSLFKQDLAVEVVMAYFGVLLAERGLEVSKAYKRSLDENYRIASNLYGQDVVSKNDVLTAEVARAQAGLKITQAENTLTLAKLNFEKVIGVRPSHLERRILSDAPLPPSVAEAVSEASQLRIELGINDLQQEQASVQSKGAISRYLPELYAQAEASYIKTDILLHKDQYILTAGLRWPFFDGLAGAGEYKSAKAKRQSLAFERQALMDRIQIEVTRALQNVDEAREAIRVEKKNRAQTAENLRIQRNMYSEGTSSAYDLLNAEALWVNAAYAYYQALYDYNIAKARTLRAIGLPIKGVW
jgi:outer membrane protein TolC